MPDLPQASLAALLTHLAENAATIQRHLDAASEAALLRHRRDSAGWPPWLAESLAPPVLRAERFEIDLELQLGTSREVGGRLGVLPGGPAFFARYGTGFQAALRLAVAIEAIPPAAPPPDKDAAP
ncbi:hypothetical protein ACFQX4_21110 [Roseomonas sp. GCM10028921]